MKTFILIACLLTYTAAQLSITSLSSGEITAGALANTTDSETALKNVAQYSFQIPPNVQSITISLNPNPNGNTACSYIYIFWSISTIPCGDGWSLGSNVLVPCRTTQKEYTSTAYEHEITIFAGEDDIAFYNTFGAGATLYLAVGKEGYDDIRTCPYTVKVESTNCTSSEVAVYYYGESLCVNVMDSALPATFEAEVEDTEIVYRFDVPQQVGYIQFEANSTGSLKAFGGYNFPANYASDLVPFCSDESSYNSEDDIYTLSATCYLPNAGKFFLTLEPSSFGSTITATVSVTPFLCGAGLGGYACQWAAHNFTGSESINGTVRAYNSSTESNYPADYYFVNLPAGTVANVNFTICSGVSHNVYVTYRKDGFPARSFGDTYGQDNSYVLSGFSCVAVVIRPEDTLLGGSYYISIENPSSTQPASYSISKTVVTFGTTTDSTTDSETTGESESAASTLFVPFMYTMIASLALY